ncbi:hypothetical protein BJV74DRAFT_384851 [Russula compacta]|nr:hypothetical protein BJV74DRAFT_384851 [Russula compacta]
MCRGAPDLVQVGDPSGILQVRELGGSPQGAVRHQTIARLVSDCHILRYMLITLMGVRIPLTSQTEASHNKDVVRMNMHRDDKDGTMFNVVWELYPPDLPATASIALRTCDLPVAFPGQFVAIGLNPRRRYPIRSFSFRFQAQFSVLGGCPLVTPVFPGSSMSVCHPEPVFNLLPAPWSWSLFKGTEMSPQQTCPFMHTQNSLGDDPCTMIQLDPDWR